MKTSILRAIAWSVFGMLATALPLSAATTGTGAVSHGPVQSGQLLSGGLINPAQNGYPDLNRLQGRSTVTAIESGGIELRGDFGKEFLPVSQEEIHSLGITAGTVIEIDRVNATNFRLTNLSASQSAQGPATVRQISSTGIEVAVASGTMRYIALAPSQVRLLRLHVGSRVLLKPIGGSGRVQVSTI